MRRFDSILVANRGEIAVRIMATARRLGYRVVAVYSAADEGALHVQCADEAIPLGGTTAAESYLCMDKIIAAARQSGATAIHPGYGFLSENADFAKVCDEAGLIFIGPSANAITLMGNKAAAKRQMIAAGVPCVPGFEGANPTDEALLKAAAGVGFPLMVKAAAGGGGRGMSLVASAEQLPAELKSARSVALNSFGSDELILERAVVRPRHVEVQVFADAHGQVIHMGERDCSVQRRHQKVVEEAPCPVIPAALRASMGEAAVLAAKSIAYCGAGTVEFLLDDQEQFYFLEMNTRLQVEHPVTEMITGLDLVELQLRVAQGLPLDLCQSDIKLDGHAIEVRLYAEDPSKNFLPRTGDITLWHPPQGEGIRVDAGIASGNSITPYYDPMLAKLVAWGEDREVARQRLMAALKDTCLFGTTSNRDFLLEVLKRETFAAGLATTAFIEEEFTARGLKPASASFEESAAAAVLMYHHERLAAYGKSIRVSSELLSWSSMGLISSVYAFEGERFEVDCVEADQYRVRSAVSEIAISVLSVDGPLDGYR